MAGVGQAEALLRAQVDTVDVDRVVEGVGVGVVVGGRVVEARHLQALDILYTPSRQHESHGGT